MRSGLPRRGKRVGEGFSRDKRPGIFVRLLPGKFFYLQQIPEEPNGIAHGVTAQRTSPHPV
jgi:hypothetical protein